MSKLPQLDRMYEKDVVEHEEGEADVTPSRRTPVAVSSRPRRLNWNWKRILAIVFVALVGSGFFLAISQIKPLTPEEQAQAAQGAVATMTAIPLQPTATATFNSEDATIVALQATVDFATQSAQQTEVNAQANSVVGTAQAETTKVMDEANATVTAMFNGGTSVFATETPNPVIVVTTVAPSQVPTQVPSTACTLNKDAVVHLGINAPASDIKIMAGSQIIPVEKSGRWIKILVAGKNLSGFGQWWITSDICDFTNVPERATATSTPEDPTPTREVGTLVVPTVMAPSQVPTATTTSTPFRRG
ncbi:MAG: hypothetical protein ABI425_03665 [Patescibacteria group bacterium]